MLHLMSLCRFRVADLPLRPLLYAAGSAATAAAAGVCYFIKRDGEETAEPADTPLTEDPVQTVSSLDPGLIYDDATQTDSAVPENFQVTLAESEEKYEQAMKSNVQLNNEKSELMSQVNTLTNKVEQLEKALSWVRQSCNRALRDSASGQRLLTALKAKTELQKKVLKRRAERLVVSLIEADARYQDALESIGQLERRVRNQRFNMTLQRNVVRSLRDQVKVSNMRYEAARMELQGKTREFEGLDFKWRLLNDTVLKDYCELTESHAMLVRQYNMLKEEHDKLQQVTLADAAAAYEQANSRAELEKEKQQLEEMLFETDTRCGVLKQSCDQTSEAYRVLMSQYKERVKQHDELLKAYLAETTEKYGPAMESNAQLSHVNILQSSVQRLEKELSEARKKCEEITMELEREREDNSNLKAQYDDITETLKQCDELLNTHHTDFMFVEPVDL